MDEIQVSLIKYVGLISKLVGLAWISTNMRDCIGKKVTNVLLMKNETSHLSNITCPASISVWNFLAATPDVVNIEAPFPYLLEK